MPMMMAVPAVPVMMRMSHLHHNLCLSGNHRDQEQQSEYKQREFLHTLSDAAPAIRVVARSRRMGAHSLPGVRRRASTLIDEFAEERAHLA
jgi:hypothetical protein